MSSRTEILARPLQYRTWMEFMYEILSHVPPPPNQNPGTATGSTSTLCIAYYTKITLLNNIKLTILLVIVNVHITEIVSSASSSLICILIGLQLHTWHNVPVYEYFPHCSVLIPTYSIFPDFPPLRSRANRSTLNFFTK